MKMLGQGACSPDGDRSHAELCVTVPASPAAGTTLRRAVRSLDEFIGPGTAEEVELLVTELATNGVKHASGRGANRITLDARVENENLHISVSDRGAGFTPEPRSPERSEPGGWGLMLVESIADRWGVEREPTTVWFELGHRQLAA
jgi:anti-sigma regulatory factor (Ser/Thr protein kinase)